MVQQLGTINRISPAAWEYTNAECLSGKAWILLRDQGIHGNVKGVRPGLRSLDKGEYKKTPPSGKTDKSAWRREPNTPRV